MKSSRLALVVLLGACSGTLSGAVFATQFIAVFGQDPGFWLPGTIFGGFIAFGLHSSVYRNAISHLILRASAYACLSTLSYFIAVQVALELGSGQSYASIYPLWLRGLIAGAIGSYFLLKSFSLTGLGQHTRASQYSIVLIGASMGTLLEFNHPPYSAFILFIPWQTIVGASLIALASAPSRQSQDDSTDKRNASHC